MRFIRIVFSCTALIVPALAIAASAEKKVGAAVTAQKEVSKAPAAEIANDPAAVALLQQIESQHGGVRSVVGSFTQQRIDSSFGADKKDSTARFALLKPNNFKVEYLSPKQSMNLINGQTSYYYVPDQKQVQKYTFKKRATVRDLNYLLLGFGAPTQELLAVYTVQRGDAKNSIKLIPRNTRDAQFKYILMELTDSLLPKRFSMEQTEGSKLFVNIDTAGLQIGAPLSPRDFQPNWPSGTNEVDMQ
ncbi:MAG: LolA family protein [Candidatus Sumerlaeaceae bacterium]